MNSLPVTSRGPDEAGVVCCLVGDEQYALDASEVRVVARAEQMRAEDGADSRVGTIRHRDVTMPVYSLAGLLGRQIGRVSPDCHVVVSGDAQGGVGILVDRAVRSKHGYEKRNLLPLPSLVGSQPRRWFKGILQVGDVSCLLLSSAGFRRDTHTLSDRENDGPPLRRADPVKARAPMRDIVVIFSSPALPAALNARYAIAAGHVVAIVQTLPAVRLPGAAPFVKELAWWRGVAVPILDVTNAPRSADRSAHRHLLVRAQDGGLMGFAVGADVTLHRASSDDRQVQGACCPYFATGIFSIGEEQIALIDPDALVTSRETSELEPCAG